MVAKHELTEGLVDPKTPHSRFNALAERDLEAKGYLTLTRSRYAGPDVFIKDEDLLEVFWQGHPEYDRDTLAREFRRDVLRYFNNEWPRPPLPPHGYFDETAQGAHSIRACKCARRTYLARNGRGDAEARGAEPAGRPMARDRDAADEQLAFCDFAPQGGSRCEYVCQGETRRVTGAAG